MTQIQHCTFQIQINQEYKLKCFINKEEQEEFITPNILFNTNEILINQENDKAIDFIKEWIDNPEDFKEYKITYQNKEYSVISELLFALIIREYKNKIEKQFIIDDTIVTIPNDNYYISKRIRTSLESIGLINITISSFNNYLQQGEILDEIIERMYLFMCIWGDATTDIYQEGE